MKIFASIFAFLTFCLLFNFKTAEIPVTIHFSNAKDLEFKKGKIIVKETNQTFELASLEDFTIPLEKGKYTISFISEDHPKQSINKRITKVDNTFSFTILTKANLNIETAHQFSEESIQKALGKGEAKFINLGFMPANFIEFEKKYGIGNSNQGCVISPNISEYARKNNQFLAKYLDEKYGKSWRENLPFLPYGLGEE